MKKSAMGKHETTVKSDEWYTPEYVFDALGCEFDTDVCSPVDLSFIHTPANRFITAHSLERDWNSFGFIWMNPPYANQKEKFEWIRKFIEHGDGIALMPDRTSAPWWQYFAENSDAILFVKGKIKFIKPDGTTGDSPGNGSTLFAIGQKGIEALKNAEQNGLGKFYYNGYL